jgi:hypothetical protein
MLKRGRQRWRDGMPLLRGRGASGEEHGQHDTGAGSQARRSHRFSFKNVDGRILAFPVEFDNWASA